MWAKTNSRVRAQLLGTSSTIVLGQTNNTTLDEDLIKYGLEEDVWYVCLLIITMPKL